MTYRIELLAGHDRSAFTSGSPALDGYFHDQVGQDIRRRLAHCFVAITDADEVAGFYTLAATSILFEDLPEALARKLPRYPLVPAVLLGRLAVAKSHQGKRLGGALVADAIMRSRRTEAMAYAMIVDAADETAAKFYSHLGFERFKDEALRLFRRL